MSKVREALCLMNSMIECGEQHSEQSRQTLKDALAIVDNINLPKADVVADVMRSLPSGELLRQYHNFLGEKQDIEWLIATKEDELINEFLAGQ